MTFELPNLEVKITKEFLLSKFSEETYMSTYLKLPIKKGLQISPLRNDKKPTASFYRNKNNELIFHDFGTGFQGNFIAVVMRLYNCSYYSALRLIAKDFGLIETSTPHPRKKIIITEEKFSEKLETIIQIERQDFTENELSWWKSYGISLATLNHYKVFSCKSVFLNGYYFTSSNRHNPIFGYYGGKSNNIEYWRIYFPRKRNYRFISNWKATQLQGAKQLKNTSYVVITKSLKDVMTLYENEINSCAPTCEQILIKPSQFNRLSNKYNDIFVLFDNDLAGVQGANKYRKQFGCKCIFIKRKYAKDISDLFKNKSLFEFNEAIKELKLIVNKQITTHSTYFYIFN